MTESELRQAPRTLPELDEEQEVDFGRYWSLLITRWWLPLIGIAAGILIGYVLSLGGNQFFSASATVYLGQPFTPGGGGQIQSLATNPRTVDSIVHSDAEIHRAAAAAGLRPGQLRGHISTKSLTSVVPKAGQSPLVQITITGRPARKVQAAANAMATDVVNAISGYVDVKIQQLSQHLAYDDEQLAKVNAAIAQAQAQLQQVQGDKSLNATDRLIALTSFNSALTFNETRQANLEQDRFAIRQLRKLAQDVERARVIEPAVAGSTTARSRRNSVLVGALIGLILGIVAALVWEPLTALLRSRRAQ